MATACPSRCIGIGRYMCTRKNDYTGIGRYMCTRKNDYTGIGIYMCTRKNDYIWEEILVYLSWAMIVIL